MKNYLMEWKKSLQVSSVWPAGRRLTPLPKALAEVYYLEQLNIIQNITCQLKSEIAHFLLVLSTSTSILNLISFFLKKMLEIIPDFRNSFLLT